MNAYKFENPFGQQCYRGDNGLFYTQEEIDKGYWGQPFAIRNAMAHEKPFVLSNGLDFGNVQLTYPR